MFTAHFKKAILSLFSIVLFTSSISLAEMPSPTSADSSQTVIALRVLLNRSITNQAIDLRRLFNLNKRYAGYRVVSVAASTIPNSPYGVLASLYYNGYEVANQYNPNQYIYLTPAGNIRLDRFGTRLHLGIQGSMYIQELQIQLSRY